MKNRILLFLLIVSLLFLTVSCAKTEEKSPEITDSPELTNENAPESAEPETTPEPETTADPATLSSSVRLLNAVTELPSPEMTTDVDLRKIVVDYMKAMSEVVWVSEKDIDYSSNGDKTLIYKAGETYMGMPYNNNKNALEPFTDQIIDGVFKTEATGWDNMIGNSCSTSILHAWQLVSPTCKYSYTVDMNPTSKMGVVAIGEIDWSQFDNKSTTTSVLKMNSDEVIYEAYAKMLPGDAFMRHRENGGHAMMVTEVPVVVRNEKGEIDPEQSYVTSLEQNNYLRADREHPSSWGYIVLSFADYKKKEYLPVTVAELQSGTVEKPAFAVTEQPDLNLLTRTGLFFNGKVTGNAWLYTAKVELHRDNENGEVLLSNTTHPYQKFFSLSTIVSAINLKELPAGTYVLTVDAGTFLGSERVYSLEITRS